MWISNNYLGSKGSLVINKGKSEEIKPKLLGKIIDTTGAGDLYAGGFIHGLINNFSIKKCGEIGSICAGHIITQLGSRSNINLQKLLREHLVWARFIYPIKIFFFRIKLFINNLRIILRYLLL